MYPFHRPKSSGSTIARPWTIIDALWKTRRSVPESTAETFQAKEWIFSLCPPSDIPSISGRWTTFLNYCMMAPVPVNGTFVTCDCTHFCGKENDPEVLIPTLCTHASRSKSSVPSIIRKRGRRSWKDNLSTQIRNNEKVSTTKTGPQGERSTWWEFLVRFLKGIVNVHYNWKQELA